MRAMTVHNLISAKSESTRRLANRIGGTIVAAVVAAAAVPLIQTLDPTAGYTLQPLPRAWTIIPDSAKLCKAAVGLNAVDILRLDLQAIAHVPPVTREEIKNSGCRDRKLIYKRVPGGAG